MSDSENSSGLYDRLIQFLEQPQAYIHQPRDVKHIQTHISHVFIAPPFVYKIKKPVDFGFLDYSTLEKRKKYCRREVELNRRLCEDVYLGVVPVYYDEERFILEDEDATDVVEYAVKMRKLTDEHFLHYYIQNDTLNREHLNRVADKLARFYREQQSGQEILKFGCIEKIRFNTDENFRQTEPYLGTTIQDSAYEAIKAYTNDYYRVNESLFHRRVEEQRIVDGHGDLHLEHIHITPDRVRIYDCIEFNERFRYGDLAADLAFLAMDLDFNNRWQEEHYFVDRMAELLEDPDLHRILDFYKCYRAYVKGKVKSLQSSEEEVSKEDRKQASEKAARYFDLSLRYALLGSQPTLLIFMGRIGTGKSTLAKSVAKKLSLTYHASDQIRKEMAGLPLDRRTPESRRDELYSAEMSRKTYEKLRENAISIMNQGDSVIMDATFSRRSDREAFARMCREKGLRFFFIETRASDQTIKKRLEKREEEPHVVSDARIEDFEKLSSLYEPPEEIDATHLISINTEQELNETVGELYQRMVEWHLMVERKKGEKEKG